MKSIVPGIAVLVLASSASAQTVNKVTEPGVKRIAPVGDVIWEEAQYKAVPGVVIGEAVQANWGSAEVVNIAAGSTLMTIRKKNHKACRERTSVRLGGFTSLGWADCLIDKDGDGRFDLVSFNEVGGAKPLPRPLAYSEQMVPLSGVGAASFRKTLTFLGKSGSDLRLSYREFADDMARPAFTEELSLPVPEQYPQVMRVKGVTINVLGLDGEGLRFEVRPSAGG